MNSVDKLTESLTNHLSWCIKYRSSSAIKVYVAEQNLTKVIEAITQFYITLESWGNTDTSSWKVFEVVKQSLYLNHNILLDIFQKPMSHPEYGHIDLDITGYNKVYFDLELNATDPYYETVSV